MARAAATRAAAVPTTARRLAQPGGRARPAPARRTAPSRPAPRQRSAAAGHVRAVAAAPIGLLDRALRGRGWVACIGLLLAGIVYLNVSLLEVNRDITTLGTRAAELNRENSILREKIAKEASSEQIQALAQRAGFVLPRPDEVRYLAANPDADAQVAAEAATPSAATTTGAPPSAATPATDTPPTEDVPPAAAAEPTASAEPPPADDPG